jgi:hypothetical protein
MFLEIIAIIKFLLLGDDSLYDFHNTLLERHSESRKSKIFGKNLARQFTRIFFRIELMPFEKLIVPVEMCAVKKPVAANYLTLIPLRLWLIELVHVLVGLQVILMSASSLFLILCECFSYLFFVFFGALVNSSPPEVLVQVVKDIDA